MSHTDIPVQCTRCKNKHMESERIERTSVIGITSLVCPRCGGASFCDLTEQVAFAWKTGLIEFGDKAPEGAVLVARGARAFIRRAVSIVARHGYGESFGQLLVPGVPEAETEQDGLQALDTWLKWCALRNGKKNMKGVTFAERVS